MKSRVHEHEDPTPGLFGYVKENEKAEEKFLESAWPDSMPSLTRLKAKSDNRLISIGAEMLSFYAQHISEMPSKC